MRSLSLIEVLDKLMKKNNSKEIDTSKDGAIISNILTMYVLAGA